MKIIFAGLLLLSILSGVTLAQQSEEQKNNPLNRGMMQDMMKGEQSGQGKEGKGHMAGMMRMMKMMDQCAAMMENCCGAGNENGKESSNK